MITLFILEYISGSDAPVVYAIPSDKLIMVENIAKEIMTEEEFESKLDEQNIEYEWIGPIYYGFAENNGRRIEIDDRISRVIIDWGYSNGI